MKQLDRKLPVRISLVGVNVALYVFTVWAIATWDCPAAETFDAFIVFCGVIAAAIGGDTWRPSGHVKAADV